MQTFVVSTSLIIQKSQGSISCYVPLPRLGMHYGKRLVTVISARLSGPLNRITVAVVLCTKELQSSWGLSPVNVKICNEVGIIKWNASFTPWLSFNLCLYVESVILLKPTTDSQNLKVSGKQMSKSLTVTYSIKKKKTTIRKITVQSVQGYECRAGHILRNRKSRNLLKNLFLALWQSAREESAPPERRFLNQMKRNNVLESWIPHVYPSYTGVSSKTYVLATKYCCTVWV